MRIQKYFIIILLFVFSALQSFAQIKSQIYTTNYTTNKFLDFPLALRTNFSSVDTGFIMMSSRYDSAKNDYVIYLSRFKANGAKELWHEDISSTKYSEMDPRIGMFTRNDTTYAAIPDGIGYTDIEVKVISPTGAFISSNKFDFDESDEPGGLLLQSGSPVIVYATGTINGNKSTSLMKVNGSSVLWNKTVYGTGDSYPTVLKASKGGVFVVKTVTSGNVVWTKTYPTLTDLADIQPTFDSGFVIGVSGGYDIMKLNKNGATVWSKRFTDLQPGLYATIRDIEIIGNGNALLVGGYKNDTAINNYMALIDVSTNSPFIIKDNIFTARLKGTRVGFRTISILSDGTFIGACPLQFDYTKHVGSTQFYRLDPTLDLSSFYFFYIEPGRNFFFKNTAYKDVTSFFSSAQAIFSVSAQVGNDMIVQLMLANAFVAQFPEFEPLFPYVDFEVTKSGIGCLDVTFTYDTTLLSDPSFESAILAFHYNEASKQLEKLGGILDMKNNTITVKNICNFSPFILAYDTTGMAGVKNTKGYYKLNVMPNPAKNNFVIEINNVETGNLNITLTNIVGDVVLSETVVKDSNSFKHSVNVSHLARGIYFLNIRSGNNNAIRKVIID
jgi:hypothetical protein